MVKIHKNCDSDYFTELRNNIYFRNKQPTYFLMNMKTK
jgi:hypothetical protein